MRELIYLRRPHAFRSTLGREIAEKYFMSSLKSVEQLSQDPFITDNINKLEYIPTTNQDETIPSHLEKILGWKYSLAK